MARIFPFRGFRYDPDRVGKLDSVITQPYDKISDDLRSDYLKRSPYNIVRVIKNEDYAGAARFLEEWIGGGVLRQDPEPCLYVYEQGFSFEGEELRRIGLIGMVALDDPELAVKGHENVLARPLEDRLNLIRQTRANEGLVFTLFSDPTLGADRILSSATEDRPPDIEVRDDFGALNRIWAISDPSVIEAAKGALAPCPLYIADGHHRYQTSVTYYGECRARGWKPAGPESFDKRMVAAFNMDSEGMRILPTHRGVKGVEGFDGAVFARSLSGRFEVSPVSDLEAFFGPIASGRHVFGFCWMREGRLEAVHAALRQSALSDPSFVRAASGPLRSLDVSVLHGGVLDEILGIGPDQVAGGERVAYFRDRGELLAEVRAGRLQLGCYLKPTSLSEVREVSEFGAKMPQKSTDFFPKLLTGLVLMKMRIAERSDY